MSRVEGELPMIEQHGIRCYKCSEEIYSNSRHDFVFCRCGEVYVDGGFDYQRVGATNLSRIENVSRSVDRKKLPFYFRKEQE